LQPSAVIGYGLGELVAAVVAGTLSLEEMVRRADKWDYHEFVGKPEILIGHDDILFNPITPGLPEQKEGDGRQSQSEGVTAEGPYLYFLRPSSEDSEMQTDRQDGIEYTSPLSLADFSKRRGLQDSPVCCLNVGFSPLYHSPLSRVERIGAMTLFSPFTRQYPQDADPAFEIMATIGRLWQYGVRVDWRRFGEKKGGIIPLPVYPFERQRYWLGADDTIEELSIGMRG